MDIRKLSETLSASPQIAVADVATVAARGFASIISNRPDGEQPDQPTAAQIAAAASDAGLAFRHIPITPGQLDHQDIAAMAEALATLPKPVFGFCRTGTRTTMMWALTEAGRQSADDLITTAGKAGYDLEGLRPRLELAERR